MRTGVTIQCSLPPFALLLASSWYRTPLRAHGPVALLPPWYAWQGVAVLLGSLGLVCPQLVGRGRGGVGECEWLHTAGLQCLQACQL